ncbi:MAG: archease [candidate division WOR-3 bacterium]
MNSGFEILEHPADIGIRSRGRSLSEAFEQAAVGLFNLMYDPARVTPSLTREVEIQSEGLDYLLHDFLSEIVYLFDADKLAFSQVEILSLSPEQLRVRFRGEQFDPLRHEGRIYVKAATLHQLKVEERGEEWVAEVYFDI